MLKINTYLINMIKKIFDKFIPSFRHKKIIKVLDNQFLFFNNIKNKINNNKKIKTFKKNKNIRTPVISNKIIKNYHLMITKKFFSVKPYKISFELKTIYNTISYMPGIKNLIIGKIINKINKIDKNYTPFGLWGLNCCLGLVPFETNICYINNRQNVKITYAKSAGSFCIKKQAKKKFKLIYIILPSLITLYLPKFCLTYIGAYTNFYINKLVEGKWGSSLKKKKKITVRGVAMNPVDHPNGGRTKTCKPERSPWGWVAKLQK